MFRRRKFVARKRKFARKRTFKKKVFRRKVKRAFTRRRRRGHRTSLSYRGLGRLGDFYQRKFIWPLTTNPINLFHGGTNGNRTLVTDFSLSNLAIRGSGTDVLDNLTDINALSVLFQEARIKKCRVFWVVQGDRTQARYNCGAAGATVNATDVSPSGVLCCTYKRRWDQAPLHTYDFTSMTPPLEAQIVDTEDIIEALNQPQVKTHSVWKGSRTFVPSQIELTPIGYQSSNVVTGTAFLAQQQKMRPVFGQWTKTLNEYGGGTTLYVNFRDQVWQGVNLNFPQIGVEQNNTYGNGNFFLTAYIETLIQFRERKSSTDADSALLKRKSAEQFVSSAAKVARKVAQPLLQDQIPAPPLSGPFGNIARGVLHSVMKRDLNDE